MTESAEEKRRRIDAHVKRVVAQIPPLPPETVDEISRILAPALDRAQAEHERREAS